MQFLLRNQSIFLVQDWTFWRRVSLDNIQVFETFFLQKCCHGDNLRQRLFDNSPADWIPWGGGSCLWIFTKILAHMKCLLLFTDNGKNRKENSPCHFYLLGSSWAAKRPKSGLATKTPWNLASFYQPRSGWVLFCCGFFRWLLLF